MKIKDIDIFFLDVPFHEVPNRNMQRQNNGWHICEIYRVETDNGLVGVGETLPNYTWGKVTDEAVARARGGNPFDLMWDDTLGAGLQMALFDVAGKAAGVPVHRLLGKQVRRSCPISWWGIDMSPEDYAAEARDAVAQGYMSFKQKARPWWDVYEQARLTAAQIPRDFKLDFDFNELLVNAATAIPVLQQLDSFPNIAIYESPIVHRDTEGMRRIRAATRSALAVHYGDPPINICLHEDMCDGFVVGGGASGIMRQAHLAEETRKIFWLQMVGTGITTAFSLHVGAVCPHAQWPAVTCMNMYVDQLITEPITILGGYAAVPDTPGLGIEFKEETLRWKVDSPDKPNVDALYAIARDCGVKTWYKTEMKGFWADCAAGNHPLDEHGVRLERWDNDGSKAWQDLAKRVEKGPVREG